MKLNPLGLALTAGLVAAPLIWLPGIAQGRDVIALFSQYLGLVALIAMALSQVIATRWPGVELLFGPLDRSYVLHKWLGISAMAAILLHDTIDAEMRGLGQETALVEAAETAGEISLYGLLILVVITIATFIPYHLWKWTHRLIGLFFVLGAAHYLFILKPFKNGDPLGLYMAAVCAVGTLAYAWTSAPRALRPARRYNVAKLEQTGGSLAVSLSPDRSRGMTHRAGQFAFISFPGAGLGEPHPFTLSSAPNPDRTLRMTIAPLGDYTSRVIRALSEGAEARVEGPFGHFGKVPPKAPQIWVAAGIGITPFLALAGAHNTDSGPVTLIWSVRDRDHAPHLAELAALADKDPGLNLIVHETATQGRVDADRIAAVQPDLSGTHVLFCGPTAMRKALGDGLRRHGIGPSRYYFETFEIRTGIGLRRLGALLWERQ